MTRNLLAIDPGNHTGLAWRHDDGTLDALMLYEQEAKLFDLVATPPYPLTIVIETFHTAGNISKYGLYTVDLIGGIKALCWRFNIPIVYHEPYVRLPFIIPAKNTLRAIRLSNRYTEHELDATAHLLSYEHRVSKGLDAPQPSNQRAVHGGELHGTSTPSDAQAAQPTTRAIDLLRNKLRS